jgi:hypothetical protein
VRVHRPGARDHHRWHKAFRGRLSRPWLIWQSKPSQDDGDTGTIVELPQALTIRGFAFSVQGEPTGDMEVNLLLSGSPIATATLAPSSGTHSEVIRFCEHKDAFDPLRVELTTLAGAELPLICYLETE